MRIRVTVEADGQELAVLEAKGGSIVDEGAGRRRDWTLSFRAAREHGGDIEAQLPELKEGLPAWAFVREAIFAWETAVRERAAAAGVEGAAHAPPEGEPRSPTMLGRPGSSRAGGPGAAPAASPPEEQEGG